MRKSFTISLRISIFFVLLMCLSCITTVFAQNGLTPYVFFAGSTGVQIGSNNTIKGNGHIGSYKSITTSGNAVLGGGNLHSDGIIDLSNNNTINGRASAANKGNLPVTSTIFHAGSGLSILTNLDVNGKIDIASGNIGGTITQSPNSSLVGSATYGSRTFGTPNCPVLPALPAATSFTIPNNATNIPNNYNKGPIAPGTYGDVTFTGNKTLTFKNPGIYYFRSINLSGNNTFVFDFQTNPGGVFQIYVLGTMLLDKISTSVINGGSDGKIYTEVQGNGGANGYAFSIANGTGNTPSRWSGTVYATNSGIDIGSGSGSTQFIGALWSATKINTGSGVTITYAPFINCNNLQASTTQTNVLCKGNATGSVVLTVSGGTAPFTYLWSNGAITKDLSNIAAGPYSVTVTDAIGCSTNASATITQPANVLSATTTQTNVLCSGTATGAINLSPTGGTAPYTFVWKKGTTTIATTEDLTLLNIGTYTVTITDAGGCTATTSATITQPSPVNITSISSNGPRCAGTVLNILSAASGGTGSLSYSWTGPNNFTSTAQNPSITNVTAAASGTYTLTVKDASNCSTSANLSVLVNANPNSNAGLDKALEFVGLTTLTGTSFTAGASYSWVATNGGIISSPANTSQITVSSQGTYTLTVNAPNGCSSSDAVNVSSKLKSIIGSELQSIFENKTTDNTFFDIKDGYVKIDIIAYDGFAPDGKRKRVKVLDTLLEGGLKLGLRDTLPNGLSPLTITGRYPIDSLLRLNNLGSIINYCRPYYRAILFSAGGGNEFDTSRTGLIRSEGDTSMKTHRVRSGYSIFGNGIKIGVISDSYSSLTSGTTATLPLQPVKIAPYIFSSSLDTIGTANPIAQTFSTNTVAQDIINRDLTPNVHELPPDPNFPNLFNVSGTDEGRAMLQIVHDVAPGSELYFRTGFLTAGNFAKGIKELKDAGCNVIVDDVTYPTEPFLRDGVIAKAVNDVKAGGVTYLSSAGNFGARSYEKDFTPMNFNGQVVHNFGGGDAFQKIRLAPGNYTFVFQWVDDIYSLNELSGTQVDMDIFMTKTADGSGLVGFNRDNLGGDPLEFIPITIPGVDSVDYNIYIVNNTPGNGINPRMKWIAFRGNPLIKEFNEGTSTLVGQANATGAIAVGAARFNHIPGHPLLPQKMSGITKPQIENFSSVGGTWVNGAPRQKPELVGPDGGNTTVKLGQDYPDWALDGYSNFFGTSAAAPHVAAAAALIMEGRKKYLGALTTTSDQIKTLFQSTAVDMETPGFDYISGAGLVDADSAMRTFAAPRPYSIRLVVPTTNPATIPGETQFLLTVTGENFSVNSEIWYGNTRLTTVYISPTRDTIKAYIPTFTDNPEIRVFTTPKTLFNDGGFSNSLYFFDADIVVSAVNTNIKYGQVFPVLDTIITINGKLLQDTTLSLADVGLANLQVKTDATSNSNVGTYQITTSFDPNHPPSGALLIKYNYRFNNAQLSIAKMPLTITPNDITVNYGEPISGITFDYAFDPATPLANATALADSVRKYHKAILPVNALAVIKDFKKPQTGGYILSDIDLTNLSMMTSFNALKNSRKFTVQNGKLVPATDLNTLNLQYLVDIASESIFNYHVNPATTNFLGVYPGINAKGLLGVNALVSNTATAIPNGGGGLAQIINGTLSEMINTSNGPVVPIVNDNQVQILNANYVVYNNATNSWDRVTNKPTDSIQLVNRLLATFNNGVPQYLPNGVIAELNGGGGLAQIINGGGGLAQIINGGGGLAQIINTSDLAIVNGGGGLAQIINTVTQQPLPDGTLVMFPNGGGGLAQIINGGGGLAQIINGGGGLAQIINGGGGLAQIINGGGGLAQIINGNTLGAGPGSNNNTAVITDQSNVNHPQTGNWLGAMFGINMITGMETGDQKLVPGLLVNPNFDIKYKLGNVHINKTGITVTAVTDNKVYDGTTSSGKTPTVGTLLNGDVINAQPTQAYDNKNVGTTHVITPSGLTIKDANNANVSGNYNINYVTVNTGVISQKPLMVTALTDSKIYNGTTSSSKIPSVGALATGDVINVQPSQLYDNKNVGTTHVMTASGLTIKDASNANMTGNYNISYAAVNTGVISQKPLTITAITDSKVYDGTIISNKIPTVGTLVSGDVINVQPKEVYDNKNVGSAHVMTPSGLTIKDGSNANMTGNYNISYATVNTGVITQKLLTVTAQDKTRPFGENNPAFTVAYTGFVTGENLQTSDVTGSPALSTTATQISPVGTYSITISNGTLASTNYAFNLIPGTLSIVTNPCLLTHDPTNFVSTSKVPTSLWLNLEVKVSGQLSANGDYLLFRTGSITFNNITSSPTVTNLAIPNGKIIADNSVSAPVTSFDAGTNTWITKVPLGYSSSSDNFITGAIINSSNGFTTKNGANSVLKGMFYSNKNFNDQWAYGMAAYQPQFGYTDIDAAGEVAATNGTYKAGTPKTQISKITYGGTGNGGNNLTGSPSNQNSFTACTPSDPSIVSRLGSANSLSLAPPQVVRETYTLGEIQVAPNPATDFIALSFVPANTSHSKITLFTIDGKKVFENDNGICEAGKKYFKRIDVSNLLRGVYIIQLSSTDKLTIKKVIISR